jgi:hypothetical protein
VPILISDPPPGEFEVFLERRRLGLDRHDEIWKGVYRIMPAPEHREYRPVVRSGLIELGPSALADRLDWP